MIKNQWYAVLDSKELIENSMIGVTRFSEKLVFWRDSNHMVGCVFDQCCHRGASLSGGKLPKKSKLAMGENLIQGDLPIIEYRKKRNELKKLQ